jgi:hypothetical protein
MQTEVEVADPSEEITHLYQARRNHILEKSNHESLFYNIWNCSRFSCRNYHMRLQILLIISAKWFVLKTFADELTFCEMNRRLR